MNKNYVILAIAILGAGILYKRSLQSMEEAAASSQTLSAPAEIAPADKVIVKTTDGSEMIVLSRDKAEQNSILKSFLDATQAESGPIEIMVTADALKAIAAETSCEIRTASTDIQNSNPVKSGSTVTSGKNNTTRNVLLGVGAAAAGVALTAGTIYGGKKYAESRSPKPLSSDLDKKFYEFTISKSDRGLMLKNSKGVPSYIPKSAEKFIDSRSSESSGGGIIITSPSLLFSMQHLFGYLSASNNIDNLIIDVFWTEEPSELIALADLAHDLKMFEIERSLVRLLLLKEFERTKTPQAAKAGLNASLEGWLRDPQQRPGLKSSYITHIRTLIGSDFAYVASSIGKWALLQPDHGIRSLTASFGLINNRSVTNLYGLAMLRVNYSLKCSRIAIIGTGVTDIPAGAFEGFDSLEVLNLSSNKIKMVDEKAFSGLNRLRKISLSNNPLIMTNDEIKALLPEEIRNTCSIDYVGGNFVAPD